MTVLHWLIEGWLALSGSLACGFLLLMHHDQKAYDAEWAALIRAVEGQL